MCWVLVRVRFEFLRGQHGVCLLVSHTKLLYGATPHETRTRTPTRCGGKVSIVVRYYENRHPRLPLPPPRISHASIATCPASTSFVLSSGSEEHRTINISRYYHFLRHYIITLHNQNRNAVFVAQPNHLPLRSTMLYSPTTASSRRRGALIRPPPPRE